MSKFFLAVLLAAACILMSTMGCSNAATGADEGEFANGAFPPTLSDTEYHQQAWSRPTCLSCHEHELDGAPKIEHKSLTAEAKLVKCRTCHVLVPGSKPK